jgi:hypothetical protein
LRSYWIAPAIERDPIYRGRRFSHEVIELCVRWFITYRLSYRDLVAMMAARGRRVSHHDPVLGIPLYPNMSAK